MLMRIKAALVIMAIIFVFTVASFFLSLSFTQRHMADMTAQELSLALDIADTMISAKISLLKSNAATIAARLGVVSDAEMMTAMATQMEEFQDFTSLTVYDRTGMVAHYGEPIDHDVLQLESEYVQAAANGESFLSSAHYNSAKSNFIIHVFIPIGTDRILSATFPGLFFSDILSEYRLWQTGSVFMVDAKGTLVASLRTDLVLAQRNFIEDAKTNPELQSSGKFYKDMITCDQVSGRYTFEGQERICVAKRVADSKSGWYIGVVAPLNESPLKSVQNGLLLSALFLLVLGTIVSIFVSGIVIKPFITIQTQATQIQAEHAHTLLLLDAMPLACSLWNIDLSMFACNEGTVRLFQSDNSLGFLDHFDNFSPEYQPDGQVSAMAAIDMLKKTFEEGKCVFEWMHQQSDGTPIPAEVTLVRVAYNNSYVVAGYVRDLREYKQMMKEIERDTNLLNTVNLVANILLQAESDKFEDSLQQCMGMIGKAVRADRVSIWKNSTREDKLYCTKVYEWVDDVQLRINEEIATDVSYEGNVPTWADLLPKGKCINSRACDLLPAEQARMALHGIHAVFAAPLFVHDEFWGFFGCDNCHNEKTLPENEVSALSSGSLLIANALVRNEMMQNLRNSSIKLEAALNDATRANNAKSSFLASMSHEMRTPLNAVIGLTDLTLENDELDGECLSNLEKINNAGMTLLCTVNDILDISKIESGKFELVSAMYDMPSLINDTVTQSIMHKGEKQIEFILNIDGNLPAQLCGDELRIKQVLNNILSNAFKYTPQGTVELGINCVSEGETVYIDAYVRDTGIGISPESIGHIFADYAQMDMQTNRKIMGTGLGLSIAKKMVELMGGTITVESEYGKGSSFMVRIPQKTASDTVIGQEMADNLKNFQYFEHKRKQNSKLPRVSLPYARVLIVDDVASNLDVAKGLMKPYGMQIDCVTSGQQAIDAIRDEKVRYNAIFMDHMMPDIDGIEATHIIREISTDYAQTIPIIALTANAIAGNEEVFLSNGFQAFIPKPIEIARLDAVIRQWVRDKDQEKQSFDRQINLGGDLVPDIRSGSERRTPSARRTGFDRRKFGKLYYELNVKKGLAHFGNDKDTYLGILRSFAVNTKPLLERAQKVNRDMLTDYVIVVHGIKGSSRGIYARLVGKQAEMLEKAARAGDFDYINDNNPGFIKTVETLITDIEDMLEKMKEENPKSMMDKPDEEVLMKLLESCKQYDMDATDAVMAELEQYEYESDNGLVAELRENVNEANFPLIMKKLSYLEQ